MPIPPTTPPRRYFVTVYENYIEVQPYDDQGNPTHSAPMRLYDRDLMAFRQIAGLRTPRRALTGSSATRSLAQHGETIRTQAYVDEAKRLHAQGVSDEAGSRLIGGSRSTFRNAWKFGNLK